MKSLWINKGPKYQLIAGYYEDTFEESLWEIYAHQFNSEKYLRFYLPVITDDLILADEGIHPEVFAASYMNFLHEDPLYFIKVTQHMDDEHRHAYCKQVISEFEKAPNRTFDEILYEDVKRMFSLYSLSYMDVQVSPMQKLRGQYKNLPLVEVW